MSHRVPRMDVMGQPEHKRIRVRKADRERINRLREGPDDTQAAVVARALDALEADRAEVERDTAESIGDVLADDEVAVVATDGTAQDLADRLSGIDPDLQEQLNRIESAATAAESNTGTIQNALEREGIGR